MALERTYWAAQRTLMAWIRTALSMISFGFTIGKLGQTLQEIQVMGLKGMHMIGIDSIAYFLVILGTGALLAAAVQFSRRVHQLSKQGLPREASIEFWVALVLSAMGILAYQHTGVACISRTAEERKSSTECRVSSVEHRVSKGHSTLDTRYSVFTLDPRHPGLDYRKAIP